MPAGRTHDRITLWALPLAASLGFVATRNGGLVLILCAGFLFGGLMLGPDLDIHSVQYKRWGIFRWIWLPYRGSMRHRSPLSHAPIVGTALRVVYLGAWLGISSLVAIALCNQVWQLGWTWNQIGEIVGRSLTQHKLAWLMLAIGLELGALSHYVADWLVSGYKRRKTHGWRAFFPAKSRRRNRRTKKS